MGESPLARLVRGFCLVTRRAGPWGSGGTIACAVRGPLGNSLPRRARHWCCGACRLSCPIARLVIVGAYVICCRAHPPASLMAQRCPAGFCAAGVLCVRRGTLCRCRLCPLPLCHLGRHTPGTRHHSFLRVPARP